MYTGRRCGSIRLHAHTPVVGIRGWAIAMESGTPVVLSPHAPFPASRWTPASP